ncbi:MAG: hypothetical protein LBD97_09115, partial [Bifidobacteriaceae bacterium]|nr:hypothetical protein [Bifidobacteriaceae bacterium]
MLQRQIDLASADEALLDEDLATEALAQIAEKRPDLQVSVAWHPNVDKALLEWLRDSGSAQAARVARVRLAARSIAVGRSAPPATGTAEATPGRPRRPAGPAAPLADPAARLAELMSREAAAPPPAAPRAKPPVDHFAPTPKDGLDLSELSPSPAAEAEADAEPPPAKPAEAETHAPKHAAPPVLETQVSAQVRRTPGYSSRAERIAAIRAQTPVSTTRSAAAGSGGAPQSEPAPEGAAQPAAAQPAPPPAASPAEPPPDATATQPPDQPKAKGAAWAPRIQLADVVKLPSRVSRRLPRPREATPAKGLAVAVDAAAEGVSEAAEAAAPPPLPRRRPHADQPADATPAPASTPATQEPAAPSPPVDARRAAPASAAEAAPTPPAGIPLAAPAAAAAAPDTTTTGAASPAGPSSHTAKRPPGQTPRPVYQAQGSSGPTAPAGSGGRRTGVRLPPPPPRPAPPNRARPPPPTPVAPPGPGT